MYPCSARIRASSAFWREAGISTVSCEAWIALRMRVRKSAIGSVIDMGWLRLPRGLRHAGNLPLVRHLAQADPAQAELAIDRARPATTVATAVRAGLEFCRSRLADALCGLRHVLLLIFGGVRVRFRRLRVGARRVGRHFGGGLVCRRLRARIGGSLGLCL